MKWLNCYKIRFVFIGFIAAIVLSGTGLANGATFTVGPGSAFEFDTIQAGIDAASDGDTVLVASGEYIITVPITFRGKAITVISEAGRDETTIRMGTPADINFGSVVIFESNESTDSVLDGFTITGGKGFLDASQNEWVGGGIFFYASSGTVRNCAVMQNTAMHGGGVLCAYPCSPNLIDCTITENSAELGTGGGVFTYGGSSLSMTNCIVAENSSTRSGGGVFAWSRSFLTLTNCIIMKNSSAQTAGGGAMCGDNSLATLTNCIILENSAARHGGVMCEESSSMTLNNCIIAKNSTNIGDGGVFCGVNSSMIITNCTITENSAGSGYRAVLCWEDSSLTVTNSIIWGNTAPQGGQIMVEEGTITINYSNVCGGQTGVTVKGGTLNWGQGNINTDPNFVDPVNDDYHIMSQAGRWDSNNQLWIQDNITSPCIDAGDPMGPIGWEPFPNGGFVNMGAYGGTPEASRTYFGEPICETIVAGDINGDGQVNQADLEIMALHWTDEEPLPLP